MVKYLEKEDDYFDLVAKDMMIVDFYADWCGPCKMLASVLEGIDYVPVLKVNVDDYPDLAQKFGVMSIPTMLFYKDGLVMKKELGYRTPEDIKKIYNEIKESSM